MKTEFNLSEKIGEGLFKVKEPLSIIEFDFILVKDVKEFIRLLKERIINSNSQSINFSEDVDSISINLGEVINIIQDLAGDKLK